MRGRGARGGLPGAYDGGGSGEFVLPADGDPCKTTFGWGDFRLLRHTHVGPATAGWHGEQGFLLHEAILTSEEHPLAGRRVVLRTLAGDKAREWGDRMLTEIGPKLVFRGGKLNPYLEGFLGSIRAEEGPVEGVAGLGAGTAMTTLVHDSYGSMDLQHWFLRPFDAVGGGTTVEEQGADVLWGEEGEEAGEGHGGSAGGDGGGGGGTQLMDERWIRRLEQLLGLPGEAGAARAEPAAGGVFSAPSGGGDPPPLPRRGAPFSPRHHRGASRKEPVQSEFARRSNLIAHVMSDLLAGVASIHESGFTHNALSLSALTVCGSERVVKVCGLGQMTALPGGVPTPDGAVGPTATGAQMAVDVYACGIVLLQLALHSVFLTGASLAPDDGAAGTEGRPRRAELAAQKLAMLEAFLQESGGPHASANIRAYLMPDFHPLLDAEERVCDREKREGGVGVAVGGAGDLAMGLRMLDRDGGMGWNLLARLLDVDPARRLMAVDALCHPFFDCLSANADGEPLTPGLQAARALRASSISLDRWAVGSRILRIQEGFLYLSSQKARMVALVEGLERMHERRDLASLGAVMDGRWELVFHTGRHVGLSTREPELPLRMESVVLECKGQSLRDLELRIEFTLVEADGQPAGGLNTPPPRGAIRTSISAVAASVDCSALAPDSGAPQEAEGDGALAAAFAAVARECSGTIAGEAEGDMALVGVGSAAIAFEAPPLLSALSVEEQRLYLKNVLQEIAIQVPPSMVPSKGSEGSVIRVTYADARLVIIRDANGVASLFQRVCRTP